MKEYKRNKKFTTIKSCCNNYNAWFMNNRFPRMMTLREYVEVKFDDTDISEVPFTLMRGCKFKLSHGYGHYNGSISYIVCIRYIISSIERKPKMSSYKKK